MFSYISRMAWSFASCQFFRTLNYCLPCGHQYGLTSHIGARLSQTDQRLFLAFIVIDMTWICLGPLNVPQFV